MGSDDVMNGRLVSRIKDSMCGSVNASSTVRSYAGSTLEDGKGL